jgi:t-SNARE complex subunit (syntaxin)
MPERRDIRQIRRAQEKRKRTFTFILLLTVMVLAVVLGVYIGIHYRD